MSLKGIVHGGQQPLQGTHVYLLAANTTGNPSSSISSVSLLTAGSGQNPSGASVLPNAYYVTTAADGSFSISGDYSCTAGQQVYLYATGGYTGGSSANNNSAIGLLAVLGNCPTTGTNAFLASVPFVWINEVSTVAAAYAFAGYAYDATHVSSSGSSLALVGIANAFANAALLNTIATGTAPSVSPYNSSATIPQSQIDTEANILAACVNTTSNTSSACTTLFSNALSGGATGTAPADTATAMLNIAHHPYVNATVLSNLFGLQAGVAAPFQPALSASPTDFTMPITISGNGLSEPAQIAIDKSGYAWITSLSTSFRVSVFTPSAAVATTPASPLSGNGLSTTFGIAFDPSGNAWVVNTSGTISVFTSSGMASGSPSSPLSGNGLSLPSAIAFDGAGRAWVANTGGSSNTVSIFTSTGAASSSNPSSPLTGNSVYAPYGLAADVSGRIWVADYAAVSIFTSTGSVATTPTSPLTGNGLADAQAIAIDPSGNAWVANGNSTSGVSAFTASGSVVSGSPFGGSNTGGVHYAFGVAVDSAGNVWCADQEAHNLGELSSAGVALSPSTGYQGTGSGPQGIAVDGSGNVWVVNSGPSTVTLYIGAASPVVTPLVANLRAPYGSHTANMP